MVEELLGQYRLQFYILGDSRQHAVVPGGRRNTWHPVSFLTLTGFDNYDASTPHIRRPEPMTSGGQSSLGSEVER